MRHFRHHFKGHFVFAGIFGLAFMLGFVSLILGYPFMLLWNHIAVGLFALPVLTFWKSVGLLILSHMFLGPVLPPSFFRNHFHSDGECGREGWGKWRYYDRFWKEEGKSAFETFVKRLEDEKGQK